MNVPLRCALLVLLAGSASASPVAAVKPVLPFLANARVETLENGLRLVLVPTDNPGVMAYYTLVRVGSRNEVEPGHSGFAHLFEHMMFRGTEKRTAAEYNEIVTSLGLEGNAFTTDDHTVYYYTGPRTALPEVIAIEAERFQFLRYDKGAFQTESKAVLGEYNKNFSNPINQMLEVLQKTMFRKHTYRHTTMGFLADIEAMPTRYDYSLGFFRRFYRPDNTTIFVVGDFDARQVTQLVRSHYGAWSGHAEQSKVPAEPAQRKERRAHVDWPAETYPRLMVAYRTPAPLPQDAAVQSVLSGYLFGPTSELYRTLILEDQLAVALESLYEDHRDPWMFGPLVVLKQADKLGPVEKAVAQAFERLRAGTIDRARFDEVKEHTRNAMLLALETPSEIGVSLAQAASPTGDPLALGARLQAIAAMTPEQAIAFAKTHFTDAGRTVVTLSTKGKRKR